MPYQSHPYPDELERCPVCGTLLARLRSGARVCTVCRGQRCNVCGQPLYADESVTYAHYGRRHLRCATGIAHPRPPWMQHHLPGME